MEFFAEEQIPGATFKVAYLLVFLFTTEREKPCVMQRFFDQWLFHLHFKDCSLATKIDYTIVACVYHIIKTN